jgi:hypothetical protein
MLGCLVVALATAVASPDAPPDQTPGSVALLVLEPFDATTSERWAAALQDARPEVRAAAARAINARGAVALAENVRRALASETDLYAADEGGSAPSSGKRSAPSPSGATRLRSSTGCRSPSS